LLAALGRGGDVVQAHQIAFAGELPAGQHRLVGHAPDGEALVGHRRTQQPIGVCAALFQG
jgi:hypothetical protein